jgi:hypothetical protein
MSRDCTARRQICSQHHRRERAATTSSEPCTAEELRQVTAP